MGFVTIFSMYAFSDAFDALPMTTPPGYTVSTPRPRRALMADHEDYSLAVTELEAELDLVYPDWDRVVSRDDATQAPKARPFQGLPLATLMRLKWLLLRRQILVAGDTSGVLISPNGRDPRKCFAVPVKKEEGIDLPEPPAKVTA